MAIIPKKSTDFTVVRRSDFPIRLQLKDGSGNAVNLSGYTVAGEVYNEGRTTKYADWNIAYTNRSNGIIDVDLTDAQTTTFTPNFVFYDFKYTQPNGKEFVYLRGKLFMLEGYTA
ncbi:phage tail protein [uncultured Mediterranean phage uvMED]|nr:phage tail protein [uncultured Mediterranean phage uvMED]